MFSNDYRQIKLDGISPFKVEMNRLDMAGSDIIINEQHTHDLCEIYLNLSGNVSFMVEDTVYPIKSGSVIITRPFEAHHCIYHSKERHSHFWILFSARDNEKLFDIFFKRERGKKNLIVLDSAEVTEFTELCEKLNDNGISTLEKYITFFKMIEILNFGEQKDAANAGLKKEIIEAVRLINDNISGVVTVTALADKFNMSIKTFERHFKSEIGMTPTEYIKSRRLTLAKAYLASGMSVLETSEKCGFSDCSHFITDFKKCYGITPLTYKKTR